MPMNNLAMLLSGYLEIKILAEYRMLHEPFANRKEGIPPALVVRR